MKKDHVQCGGTIDSTKWYSRDGYWTMNGSSTNSWQAFVISDKGRIDTHIASSGSSQGYRYVIEVSK